MHGCGFRPFVTASTNRIACGSAVLHRLPNTQNPMPFNRLETDYKILMTGRLIDHFFLEIAFIEPRVRSVCR